MVPLPSASSAGWPSRAATSEPVWPAGTATGEVAVKLPSPLFTELPPQALSTFTWTGWPGLKPEPTLV